MKKTGERPPETLWDFTNIKHLCGMSDNFSINRTADLVQFSLIARLLTLSRYNLIAPRLWGILFLGLSISWQFQS